MTTEELKTEVNPYWLAFINGEIDEDAFVTNIKNIIFEYAEKNSLFEDPKWTLAVSKLAETQHCRASKLSFYINVYRLCMQKGKAA
jgi:hypothetical protein